jgi:hypothetical protein
MFCVVRATQKSNLGFLLTTHVASGDHWKKGETIHIEAGN